MDIFSPATRRSSPAFTMIEVLVTISISTIIFLAVSNLMVSFFRINTEIKKDVDLNNEREEVYLEIRNFLDEAQRVVYREETTNGDAIVLVNKPESSLLPFTLILPDTDKKLKMYNFALDPSDGTTPRATASNAPPLTIDGAVYQLDYTNSRITKGNSNTNTACSLPSSTDCILTGFQPNKLAYGTTAFAPFIQIFKPTAMRQDGINKALLVLSPYEQREYRIDLTTLQITTTANANNSRLPYRYGKDNLLIYSMGMNALPDSVQLEGLPTVRSTFDIADFRYEENVYGNNSFAQIDQIIYTIQNPQNEAQQSTSFLFKLFPK